MMSWRHAAVAVVLLTSFGRLSSATANAPASGSEGTGDERDAGPTPVEVIVIGTSPDSVRPVVDVFSRRDAHLRLVQVPVFRPADVLERVAGRGVAARVWVEVSRSGRARITIADRQAERFLVRDLELPDWPDEVGRETLAQLVESSVTALLENGRFGMNRAEAHSALAVADEPKPAASPLPPPRRSAALFYDVQLFSPRIAIAQGPGVWWEIARDTSLGQLAGWVRSQYVLPQSYVGDTVGVELQAIALRCGAGLQGRMGARSRVAARLGGGVDLVHVAPRQGLLGVTTLNGAHWTAVTVVRAELGVALTLGDRFGLSITPSLELDPVRRHYDVQGSDAMVAVVAPYLLRPGVSLALEWR